MADAISLAASIIQVLDTSLQVYQYLQKVKAGAAAIENDINALLHEIELLQTITKTIEDTFKDDMKLAFAPSSDDEHAIDNLWRQTAHVLRGCREPLLTLEDTVKYVVGKGGLTITSKSQGILRFLRKDAREDRFVQARQRLSSSHRLLEINLTAINICYARRSEYSSSEATAKIAHELQHLKFRLEESISTVNPDAPQKSSDQIHHDISAASAVLPLDSINEHWGVPFGVSSLYTGREQMSKDLNDAFFKSQTSSNGQFQKRFVVYGMGGSGKTQFCLKFAQENRDKFWGVFWIDASSRERVQASFANIAADYAKVSKEEQDDRRAKHWLAHSKLPWLLIVDNADDPEIPVSDCFPPGERGCILITTRNHSLKTEGTLSPAWYHFSSLEEEEGISLLLKTAARPFPWDGSTLQAASKIGAGLGYLPLALVLAGTAIREELCTLGNYLEWYLERWDKLRLEKGPLHADLGPRVATNFIVYGTYEAIFQNLESRSDRAAIDALGILKIFAFFQRESVKLDVFTKASRNYLEAEERKRHTAQYEKGAGGGDLNLFPQSRLRLIIKRMYQHAVHSLQWPYTSDVPRMLRDLNEDRLRDAVQELRKMSLVNYDEINETYSLHPLIHIWVRKRPMMTIGEQAIWCHTAACILAEAIVFTPKPYEMEGEDELRRVLHPHVEHVRQCQEAIDGYYSESQKTRTFSLFWAPEKRVNLHEALRMVKFSVVYMGYNIYKSAGRLPIQAHDLQLNMYRQAEALQTQAINYLSSILGPSHPTVLGAQLMLSGTYWHLGRGSDALSLLGEVLKMCTSTLGQDDVMTCGVKDAMGVSLWLQGRSRDAKTLLMDALVGFERSRGAEDPATLRTMMNLGRVCLRRREWDEAIRLHSKALEGLRACLGPSHSDSILAMEGLALAHFERSEYHTWRLHDLNRAYELESMVVPLRVKQSGERSLYTLGAQINLARILTAQGNISQAESLLHVATETMELNLGQYHMQTLLARCFLGNVLVLSGKHETGQKVLQEVIAAHSLERRSKHPDCLTAKSFLLKLYMMLDNQTAAEETRQQILEALTGAEPDRPWEKYLLQPPSYIHNL